MGIVLVPADGGEVLANPSGMRILEDGSNTGHRMGMMEGRLAPNSGGPPQHIHREHSETFYVVSGKMRFTSAGEHVDVPAGGVLTAPVGVPHTFSNPHPDEAVFLCMVSPDLYIGYFRELAALAEAHGKGIGEVDANAVRGIMARYATEGYHPNGS